ncbi:hypothetical protein BVG16_16420 [Paenibacillus selenitireducens]|uniref:Uncharacterized protein n=1 Tax=Paenibacillus selenitireducens TaxID=1324314 RepID=A0A1T2XA21_9BACL|nr:hypothetical protein [Paenibacillus selenitireducens]OPA76754.1 hypothetical protein BVG16_16420 [Paenibacillus selenitireducens]
MDNIVVIVLPETIAQFFNIFASVLLFIMVFFHFKDILKQIRLKREFKKLNDRETIVPLSGHFKVDVNTIMKGDKQDEQ